MNTKDYFKQNTGKPKGKEFWQGYYSNVPRVKYVLEENEKLALREVGKFLKKEMKKIIKAKMTPSKKSPLLAARSYKVVKKTKSLNIGTYGNKKNPGRAFYSKFLEFGTKKMKARPFIRPTVQNNISKVRAIVAENMGNVTKDKVVPVKTDEVISGDKEE